MAGQPQRNPGPVEQPPTGAPYRGPAFGARHAVASAHPAASLIGMDVLRYGGSAADAAIAVSAAKVVTKPDRSHLGGDAFALLWRRDTNTVECLNAGGRASHNATSDRFANGMPAKGPLASTVPGLVDAWAQLHQRHGRLPFADLLAPAIALAEEGFPVSTHLALSMPMLADNASGAGDENARAAFLKNGEQPYIPGEILRQPELAETLRAVAAGGRDAFYNGPIGRAIAGAMRDRGGLIDEEDLAAPLALWHDPLVITYRGCTVYEQALPSQGIILLQTLKIAERFPFDDWGVHSPDAAHVAIEAIRLAFADRKRYAADAAVEEVPVDWLLSDGHAAELAAQIDLSRASAPALAPVTGDTTSFVVADQTMAVSFIQSVYWLWGSGFVVPGTGILMNNRMLGFHTDPASPNCVAPGKRAVHTLNTFLVVRDGRLLVGGGTPGADFQVQVNLQTVCNVVDYGLDLQSALDAPRFVSLPDGRVLIETRFPHEMLATLESRGHHLERAGPWFYGMSNSQAVASLPGAGWAAASDLRSEGCALAG
jgi:gamma-glutamyltranspeptidase/glutathione hydrolase